MSQKYSFRVFILWQFHTHNMLNLWSCECSPITILIYSSTLKLFFSTILLLFYVFCNSLSLTLTSCMSMSRGIIYQNRSISPVPAMDFPSPSVTVGPHEPLPKARWNADGASLAQVLCMFHSCSDLMSATLCRVQKTVLHRTPQSLALVFFFSLCQLSSESLKAWHRCPFHGSSLPVTWPPHFHQSWHSILNIAHWGKKKMKA